VGTVTSTDAVIRLHPDDPVAVARHDLEVGTGLESGGHRVVLRDAVPRGHKVALVNLPQGAAVRKYGQLIGITRCPIAAGEHVHGHNLVSPSREAAASLAPSPAASNSEREPTAHRDFAAPTSAAPASAARSGPVGDPRTFAGIVRPDGRVGTRNYLAVLSSVNCSATVVKRIVAAFSAPGSLDDYPGVDGVMAITHNGGCGLAGDGQGLDLLRRTLAGYARHPNVAGVVVVGLGCEVNQVSALVDQFHLPSGTPVQNLTIQQLGGSVATVREGIDRVRALLPEADAVQRRLVPASALTLGLNCGGSDAWSGVTANPVLGVAVDRLIACGGTAVLGETPEIHGAEHLLTSRAASAEVAEALMERVAWWEKYAGADGGSLDNNPSPGNRAGGVTTIEEKSLGAVAKGGSSLLRAVYGYAEPVSSPGLVFMDTPGYDPVSVTGIVAGGANVVCFTTGRGSVFGCKPAPSLKLATTSELYRRMGDDMDFNCGSVLDGDATVSELGDALFEAILAVASGRHTKSEDLGFGDEEFTPWQLGAVM
jgi:altronate hydrolase